MFDSDTFSQATFAGGRTTEGPRNGSLLGGQITIQVLKSSGVVGSYQPLSTVTIVTPATISRT